MFIKKLLFLLLLSSWCQLSVSSNSLLPFHPRDLHSLNKTCVCFQKPPSYTNVVQVIDTGGSSLERLVVYFYKNLKTNEVKMFTPNIEKQRLIPNLVYESGDFLNTVSSQDVIELFNTNPNVIIVESSVRDEDVEISIPKEQPGYNVEDNKGVISTDYNEVISEFLGQYGMEDKKINKFDSNSNELILSGDLEPIKISTNSHNDKNTKNNNNEMISSNLQTSDNSHQDMNGTDIKDKVVGYQTEASNGLLNNDINLQNFVENNLQPIYSDLGELNSKNPESSVVIPMNYKYTDPLKRSQSVLIYPVKNKFVDIFESWFKNQMGGYHKTDFQLNKNDIDTNHIKTVIQEILLKNKLVTKDGVVNKDGLQNLSDLRLRPIIIDDTIGYDKFLQSEDKKDISTPFLHAVLVSQTDPSKILDVVPLDKSRIANTIWQAYTLQRKIPFGTPPYNLDENLYANLMLGGESNGVLGHNRISYPVYNGDKYHIPSHIKRYTPTVKHSCKTWNCKGGKKSDITNNGEDFILSRPQIQYEYEPHNINYNLIKALTQKLIKSKPKVAIKLDNISKKTAELVDKTSFPFTNMLSKLVSQIIPNTEETIKRKDQEISIVNGGYYDKDEGKIKNDIEDDKESMIRIIGGTAATGTGTPLKTRGRRWSI